MNKFEWINDPARIGYCWDYVTNVEHPYGYVLKLSDHYIARTTIANTHVKYATMEEAKAVVEAIIAMKN